MKRYGNLFKRIVDINNIVRAHLNARKGKTKDKDLLWLLDYDNTDRELYEPILRQFLFIVFRPLGERGKAHKIPFALYGRYRYFER